MANFIKVLVNGGSKKESSCCGIEIKEVSAEKADAASESCCSTDLSSGTSCCSTDTSSSDSSCCG